MKEAVPERTIRLVLAYDGTEFHGWQRQPGLRTVQGEVERAARSVFGRCVPVTASGRTDAGVHALGQSVHFVVRTRLDAATIARAVDAYLPEDVAVRAAAEERAGFHARRDARRKSYVYHFLVDSARDPLWRRYTYFVRRPLDLAAMRAAAAALVGRRDFRSFVKGPPPGGDAVRHLMALRVLRWRRGVRLVATADGFLQHQVRALAGALLLAGRGRLDPDDVERILAAKDRRMAPPALPARGLLLWRVDY